MRFYLIYPLMTCCSITFLACAPGKAGSETDTAASSSSGDPTGPVTVTGTGDPTDTSTGGPTSTGDPTDTSISDPTDTSTGDPLDPVCAEPPDTMDGPSWPDNYVWFPAWGGSLDEPCVLEGTEVVANGLKLVLDCPKHELELGQDTYEFVITAGPLPTLPPIGATIDAFGEFGGIDISNDTETLILRSEGKLLYAAVRALHLNPMAAGPEFYAPLLLNRVDRCPLMPFGNHEDTGFFPDGDGFVCERGARAQVQVSTDGSDDLLLLDGETGMIAAGQTTYAVDVRRAWQLENCHPELSPGLRDMVGFAIAAQ